MREFVLLQYAELLSCFVWLRVTGVSSDWWQVCTTGRGVSSIVLTYLTAYTLSNQHVM